MVSQLQKKHNNNIWMKIDKVLELIKKYLAQKIKARPI